jgi:hypothetical protein
MEHDIYELLRASGITCEKIDEVFNALAEICEKIGAWVEDLLGEIGEKLSKSAPKKLRPNYKDKCKIRWLDIPNKVMQGRIRRFC